MNQVLEGLWRDVGNLVLFQTPEISVFFRVSCTGSYCAITHPSFFVSRKIYCSFSFFALFEIFAIAFLPLYSDFSGIAKRFSFSCFQSIKLFYISWCRPYSIVSRFIHIRLQLILKIAQLPSNYFYHLVESHLLFYVAMLFAREGGSF